MDDRDFFDHLFQQFARTTGAENTFWAVEKREDYWVSEGSGEDTEEWKEPGEGWDVYTLDQDQRKTKIGHFDSEVDADFVAGLHGCIPDLVRRLHDALDEADRLDRERDEAEQNVFRLAVENDELRAEAAQLRRERESWVSKTADTLWKIERPM